MGNTAVFKKFCIRDAASTIAQKNREILTKHAKGIDYLRHKSITLLSLLVRNL